MMPVIDGVMLAVGSSLAASIVVKVTVTTALALIAAWLARGNRAAVRHALLAAMFGVMLLLPIASVVMPPLHVGVPVGVQSRTALLQLGTGSTLSHPSRRRGCRWSCHSRNAARVSKLSMSNLLLAGWAVGVAIFLLPVVIGLWQIRSLRRSGLPWRRGQSVVETLALDAGIHRRVEVLLHEALPGPMTCGVVHPAIVLPRTPRTGSREDLNRAIVHELEHVRRGDSVSRCLARVACAVYWFHPLVWIAWRRLALEAERSCDDAVLRRSEATAYADQLVGLAKRLLATQIATPGDGEPRRSGNARRRGARQPAAARPGRDSLAGTRMHRRRRFVLALSPLTMIRAAQDQQPAFEVASVRPNNSPGFRNAEFHFLPSGRLVIRNEPLSIIVAAAYDLPFFSPRLTGGPEWEHAAGEKYDIEAVAPEGAVPPSLPEKARDDKMSLMLQSLLEERFKLKMRIEPREQPVYALVVAKNGPKLQKAKMQEKDCPDSEAPSGTPTACHSITGGMDLGIHGDAVSLADVALFVQNWSDRPVVDRTGLTDLFNIQTEGWAPMRPKPPSPDGQPPQGGDAGLAAPDRQTLADVFRELGLKMESQRAVVDMFFVEHVERPTGN